MLINIDDTKLNGAGSILYSVSVNDSDGDPLGTALWLADSDADLEEQLFLDFAGYPGSDGDDDSDLELSRTYFNIDFRPGCFIECIGQTAPEPK